MTTDSRESGEISSTLAASAPLSIRATVVRRRPWASALFTGARWTITVAAEDDAALDEWLATVPELDLPLRRRFVADAELVERSANAATLEMLVVDS